MSKIMLEQIKLANSVKLGRSEEIMFHASQDYRGHGTDLELVAMQMPVANSPGDHYIQPLVKLTDKMSKQVTYTSLMNAIYFTLPEKKAEKPKRGKVAI